MTIAPSREEFEQRLKALEMKVISDCGPGRVHMNVCSLCGGMSFAMSETALPNSVVWIEQFPSNCARCQEAFARAPEIARWVEGCIGKLRRDILMGKTDPKASND